MPRPALRTRSLRKIRKKLPGGASIIHYIKKKPKRAVCANCGKPLHGVAGGLTSRVRGLSKSRKRPERPYGGKLCAKCARAQIKKKIR
jgi:large subunit ribosomal protein L34e